MRPSIDSARRFRDLCWVVVFGAAIVGTAHRAHTAEPAGNSTARWIGVEAAASPNQWLAMRKTASVADSQVGLPIELKIAADSKYWLWINGEMLVFEGGLKRGPTPTDTYLDTVTWIPASAGEHTLAILVWHFGKEGFSHKNSGQAGLLVDQIGGDQFDSNASWSSLVHPAYGDTEGPHPNGRLAESNIRFDAAADLNWTAPEFDAGDWPAAVERGGPGDRPWGKLVDRPIPHWKDYGIQPYTNDASLGLPRTSKGEVFEGVLPYNAQVTPTIRVRCDGGRVIDIRTDNYRGGGPPNVRAEYVTRAGEQFYENLGWMNGHTVRYDVPEGVEVLELGYRETGFDTEFVGTFVCDDPFLNRLRDKASRTLYVTMRDTYFDCPDRERAQWWGDAVLELGEAFYALDLQSHRLARKGIRELMGWQRDDHTIFSPVPAGNYSSELPMQMLASVGRYGFWTYAWHSGDVDTIREVYPRVVQYLGVWEQADSGLVVPRNGGWTWGDWGENKDMPLLFNAWYYLALDGQRGMAKMLGRDDEVPAIEAKMARLKTAFNDSFWTGTQYRSPDYQGITDDRGHALAVVSGIADASQYDAITKVLRRQRHSSPYMEKYVLEALYQMNQPALALERMKQRYQKMVESDYSTLWEGWGIGAEGFGGGTINHAWSGGPLTIMSQFMAGISPTSLGYRSFEVRPQLGPLQHIDAHVESVSGPIDVAIQRGDSMEIVLGVPEGTTATVRLPDEHQEIRLGDRVIWTDGRLQTEASAKQDPSIRADHRQGEVHVSVPAGEWTVTAAAIPSP